MGKSLFITRMAEKLKKYKSTCTALVTIPIHGPEVTPDIILEFLKDHINVATSTILHFDIAPTVSCFNCRIRVTIIRVTSFLFCYSVFFLLSSYSFDSFTLPFLLISLQTLWKVDTILFCLLILRGLSDSQGRVWRRHPTQLYAIEVTLPEQQQQSQQVFRLQICICDFDNVPATVVMQKNNGMQYSLN